MYIINKNQLESIFSLLKKEHEIIAPVLKDNVIQLSQVKSIDELPFGYKEKEEKNFYRVEKNKDEYLFSYIRPSVPYKRFLIPPEFTFLIVKKENGELKFVDNIPQKKYTFFDIRACDLKAIEVLDNIFLNKNKHSDPYYKAFRENLFIVAVSCREPSDVCFCSSMGISPKPKNSFDILLTELEDGFLVETGTEKGKRLIENIEHRKASEEDIRKAKEIEKNCIEKMKRDVDTKNLPEILYKKIESPYWNEVGKRCLACTSCTQLCPTCFCFDIVEKNDPVNNTSERVRVYDSCFSPTFATVHRFNIRQSIASRYRQWLMHKFAYWTDQFGEFGCVGCGRCITWCPASIDITEEIKRFREE